MHDDPLMKATRGGARGGGKKFDNCNEKVFNYKL